jgi:integrase
MSTPTTMTDRVADYLTYRRSLGYKLRIEGYLLKTFARFADESGHRGPLTVDLALSWSTSPHWASREYHSRRLGVLRRFAQYMAVFEPCTEIPPADMLGPSRSRKEPYIFSDKETLALVRGAGRLPSPLELRGSTYATLIGLLACTGMRIGEALRLTRGDVNLEEGVVRVRESKGQRSRLLPLHPTATDALIQYAKHRDSCIPSSTDPAFFLSERGRAPRYNTVCYTFRHLCVETGATPRGRRLPRLHDLRHTFACRRLQCWYEDGVDIDHAISALSTYLGHTSLRDTYWYLTGVPELFNLCGKKFERFVLSKSGDPS